MKFTPPFIDRYKSNPVGPPRDSSNAEEKVNDKEWFVNKGSWLYSLWLTNYAFIPYSTSNEFAELRMYAQGRQPVTKYMDILDPRDPDTQMRSGFYNMSWDIVPIFPKYRDRIRGALSRFDYSTSVQALDDNSQMDRTFLKFKSFVMEQEKAWMQAMAMAMGQEQQEEIPDETLPAKPRSIQEMEMIESMGGYRLPLEASFEKLLYKSAKLSEWDEIKLRLEEDAIDLGVMVTQDYTDPISGLPMVRYVDPAFWICANTRDNAYSEISDAAEIRFFTLAELKDNGLTDDEIMECAQTYQGLYTNPTWTNLYQNGQWNWYFMGLFRVAVLDMDFSSWSTDHYESRTISSTGQEVSFKIGADKYGKDPKKKKYSKKTYERRYQGKWVIGTKIVMPGYGYQYNQVFDSDSRPKCSYSAYRVSDRSITSRCISVLDDIQLAVLKFRNAWAKAKPAGLMVEWGSLSGMTMGGKKLDPLEIMRIYRTTGDLLYRAASENGRPIQGASAPIMELQGGIGQMLKEFVDTFNTHISTLAEITAIGRGQDGTLPGGDTLVGVANMAEAATQDTFRPIVMGYKRIKSRVMNNLCLRWQLRLASGDVSEYVESKEGVSGQIVKLSYDEVRGRRIQVACDMLIDDTQKQMAIQAALESIKAAKTGQVGITYADFLVVMQAIERGQIKFAFMWIHYREEQEKMYQQQLQAQNMQMNQQGAMQLEQAKQQALEAQKQSEGQLEMAKIMGELEKIKAKGEEDRKTLKVKYALETGAPVPTFEEPSSSPRLSESSPQALSPTPQMPMGASQEQAPSPSMPQESEEELTSSSDESYSPEMQ